VPGVDDRPTGCLFNPRCTYADERCRQVMPDLTIEADGRQVRCLKPLNGVPAGAAS
jgi:oligopeptide/dipeptide ABC transporter ATP-binding protein